MRNKMRAALKIVFLILPMVGFSMGAREKLRALDIQVIDAGTRQPLPGMVVYYGLQTTTQEYVLIFPKDPCKYGIARYERLVTDQEGKAYIPECRIKMKFGEHPYTEVIMVNLEDKDGCVSEDEKNDFFLNWSWGLVHKGNWDHFIRPNKEYEGYHLYYDTDDPLYPPWKKRLIGACVAGEKRGGGLTNQATVIIELERKGVSR